MKSHDYTIRHPATRSSALRQLLLGTMAACLMALSLPSSAGLFLSVSIAPPPLPIYAQPIMPGPGYLWTPGYWAYGDDGYFWVPGTWVLPPFVGALWTPGWWGWNDGAYVFNDGYWGTSVGFYGGIDYGYGYGGRGYSGGRWDHGAFSYNRADNRIDPRYARNVYDGPASRGFSRVSYNGGRGGVMARPSTGDMRIANERRAPPVAAQRQQVSLASRNRALRASVNHGTPAIAATPRAGVFSGNGIVRASRGTPAPTATRMARANGQTPANASLRSAGFAHPNRGSTQAPAQYSHAGSRMQPSRNAAGYPGAARQGMSRPAPSTYQQRASRQNAYQPQQHAYQPRQREPQHAYQPQQRELQHAYQPRQRESQHAYQPQQRAYQPQQHARAQAPSRPRNDGNRGEERPHH